MQVSKETKPLTKEEEIAKAEADAKAKAAEKAMKTQERFDKDLKVLKTASTIKSKDQQKDLLEVLEGRFRLTRAQWESLVEDKTFKKDFVDMCMADYGMLKKTSSPGGGGTKSAISTICGYPSLKSDCINSDGKVFNEPLATAGLKIKAGLEEFRLKFATELGELAKNDYYLMEYLRYAPETETEEVPVD